MKIIMNEYEKRRLEREERIKKLVKEDLEEYRRRKVIFDNNPLHWANNKRKIHHLPVLRGNINKNRLKRYHRYFVSAKAYLGLESIIDEAIADSLNWSYFEENFVSVNELKEGREVIEN
jgi:hypothetical protein